VKGLVYSQFYSHSGGSAAASYVALCDVPPAVGRALAA